VLERLDRYFDAAPRPSADPEEVGPFTLFRSRAPWPYYARPQVGLDTPIAASDVERLADRCAELQIPLAIEWIGELTPSLEPAAAAAGWQLEVHPLLVVETNAQSAAHDDRIEILAADDPRLVLSRAVAEVGFATPGTAVGEPGTADRDERAARVSQRLRDILTRRAADGLTVTAVDSDVLATGSLIPVGDTAEIVGVATLPAYRRRGLAGAITRGLIHEARRRGVTLVVISAGSEEIARIYEHAGFRSVGTHVAASREG
jgi:ribosomal protein S18 acetylase RimI-like enzyme